MFDSILGDIPTPLKFILAFAIVIALIVIAAWLIRRFGGQRFGPVTGAGRSRQPRLGVLDVLNIDGRRRLVIVRRDNVEHLVMIGGPNDVVVESGILRLPAGAVGQRDAAPLIPVEAPVVRGGVAPQPVAAAQRPTSQGRAAEAPPVQPAAPRVPAPAVQTAPPLVPSSAPVQPPVAPRPALAPGQVRPGPAPAAPRPASETAPVRAPAPQPAVVRPPAPQSQPIIAGPAARSPEPTVAPRSNELAERLATALRRPVTPAPRAPAPESKAPEIKASDDKAPEQAAAQPEPVSVAEPKPASAPAAAPVVTVTPAAPAAQKPAASAPVVAAPQKADAADLPRAMPPMMTDAPEPTPQAQKSVAPDVRPANRAEPETEDDDEFSLEAEMANLLGRDMSKPKP